jgi:hypothetical protein
MPGTIPTVDEGRAATCSRLCRYSRSFVEMTYTLAGTHVRGAEVDVLDRDVTVSQLVAEPGDHRVIASAAASALA